MTRFFDKKTLPEGIDSLFTNHETKMLTITFSGYPIVRVLAYIAQHTDGHGWYGEVTKYNFEYMNKSPNLSLTMTFDASLDMADKLEKHSKTTKTSYRDTPDLIKISEIIKKASEIQPNKTFGHN